MWKKSVLVALASAKRIGELELFGCWIVSDGSAVLCARLYFRFLYLFCSHSFSIPAASWLVGKDDTELSPCPVRTFKQYLCRTRILFR